MNSEQTHKPFRAAFQKWALDQKRGFQAKIARKTDISPVVINEILREKRPGTEDQRRAIARAIGYKYEDFLDLGRGVEPRSKSTGVPEGDYYWAPLVDGKIAAGSGALVDETEIKSKVWIYAPELRHRRKHRLTAVQVSETNGKSMLPTIAPKDIVLIDHDDPGGAARLFKSGKIYAVRTQRIEGDASIKRVYQSGKNLVLGSDNRDVPPEVAWSNEINELVIGRVVWAWRNLQEA